MQAGGGASTPLHWIEFSQFTIFSNVYFKVAIFRENQIKMLNFSLKCAKCVFVFWDKWNSCHPHQSGGIAQLNWVLLTFPRPNNLLIKCLMGLFCQDLKAGSLARAVLLPQWMGKIRICYLIFMGVHNKQFHFVPLMVMAGSNIGLYFRKRQQGGGGGYLLSRDKFKNMGS